MHLIARIAERSRPLLSLGADLLDLCIRLYVARVFILSGLTKIRAWDATLALFRDDPQQINSLLTPFENVTAAQVKAAAAKYLVATNRTVIDRVPEAKPQPKTGQ